MTTLAEILHNIADHTQTLLHLIDDPSVPAEFTARLKQHMLLEEKENTAKLEALQSSSPHPLTRKLLDHSFFIQTIMQESAVSVALQRELLDHFMEEHQEWTAELSPASNNDGKWTVGPMWPQGG